MGTTVLGSDLTGGGGSDRFDRCLLRFEPRSFFSDVRWLGTLLIMLFMVSVSIIMMNILVAQLSLTYELVQEESLLSFTAVRMQSVSTVDWESRFKFWVRDT